MPIHNVSSNNSSANDKNAGGRTTFRPPWVKGEAAQQPAAPILRPWSQRQKATDATDGSGGAAAASSVASKDVKLQSKEIKVPVQVASTAKPAARLQPQASEDVEGVKNGLRSMLRKTEQQPPAVSRKTDDDASTQDKSGKFVRPVLKKVVRPEPAPIPPKAPPLKPVVMAPIKKDESSDEEDSDDDDDEEEVEEEEETETETETESDSESEPEVVVAKKCEYTRQLSQMLSCKRTR